jgi:hypothetical protein
MGWIQIDGKRVPACYSRQIYEGYLDGKLDEASFTVQGLLRDLKDKCANCLTVLEALKNERRFH